MSTRPSKDSSRDKVPPARREATEISLEEIDQLHRKIQPQPQRRSKWLGSLLLLAGLGGVGVWQWDAIRPHFNGMKAAIAATDFNFLSKEGSSAEESAIEAASTETSGVTVTQLPGGGDSTTADESALETDGAADSARSDSASTEETNADTAAENEADTLLNHRRYEVAPAEDLVPLNPNSMIKLQPEAQAAIQKMLAKAKIEGVQLGLISGYRTLEDQNYLYFDLKAERGESAQSRAEVSAPPGYSEHHTGYAVDFIDESKPDTHLSPSFENTDAFKWLKKNAPYFNFELSFPKNNDLNIRYEPWHWRYVGNQESLELFYKE